MMILKYLLLIAIVLGSFGLIFLSGNVAEKLTKRWLLPENYGIIFIVLGVCVSFLVIHFGLRYALSMGPIGITVTFEKPIIEKNIKLLSDESERLVKFEKELHAYNEYFNRIEPVIHKEKKKLEQYSKLEEFYDTIPSEYIHLIHQYFDYNRNKDKLKRNIFPIILDLIFAISFFFIGNFFGKKITNIRKRKKEEN